MKQRISRIIFLFAVLSCANLSAISMVYNFRIAQITKQPIIDPTGNPGTARHCTVIALIFDQWRKKRDDLKQNYVGGLGSFIYDFKKYYFRVDAAVAHIKEDMNDDINTFSGTETDDILFTFGRNFAITNKSVVTLSGFLGVPTHRILRLEHADFGYSQVGLGLQFDGSYTFMRTNAVLYGMRYIYFVPRNAGDYVETYKFTVGNVADMLLAYKKNWRKHGLEFGYTARFRFGAHITPDLDEIVEKTNYIRSSFYGVYKYKFLIKNVSNRLLLNLSYGLDHQKPFGNKYIVTLWGSWNINF